MSKILNDFMSVLYWNEEQFMLLQKLSQHFFYDIWRQGFNIAHYFCG